MLFEELEKEKLIAWGEDRDELDRLNGDIVKREKVEHLPRYAQLRWRPFTKAGWFYTYLENAFYRDKLRVDVNGVIYRHPYSQSSKSYDMNQWVVVNPQKGPDGYLQFSWHTHTLQVHRIVALAWCERTGYDPDGNEWGEDDKLEVDHIDFDRTNNHPTNLRWVTKSWNAANTQRTPSTRKRNRNRRKKEQTE